MTIKSILYQIIYLAILTLALMIYCQVALAQVHDTNRDIIYPVEIPSSEPDTSNYLIHPIELPQQEWGKNTPEEDIQLLPETAPPPPPSEPKTKALPYPFWYIQPKN